MAPTETQGSRTQTDESLKAERARSDDELLTRSMALSEDADTVIERARERAHKVLALSRDREDRQMESAGATVLLRAIVQQERHVADATLAAERSTADSKRLDERERRQAALFQLLAHERDATDRTLAAERFVADRTVTAREDLLAIVAHDLRNMLSTMVVNAAIVVVAPELNMVRGPGARIQQIGAQMAQLLEDLLDFSSFEAGKLKLRLDDVNVTQIVADAVSIHEEVAREHQLALSMRSDAPSIQHRGDGKRLTRVLLNLIGNGIKFTPAGGRIDVHVSVVGDECEIAVTDTGIGIPKDQLETVFERFRQVGREPHRSTGVGLGLYIARLIVEAHGGRIWAESEQAHGATFKLRLPMHTRSA